MTTHMLKLPACSFCCRMWNATQYKWFSSTIVKQSFSHFEFKLCFSHLSRSVHPASLPWHPSWFPDSCPLSCTASSRTALPKRSQGHPNCRTQSFQRGSGWAWKSDMLRFCKNSQIITWRYRRQNKTRSRLQTWVCENRIRAIDGQQ